MKLSTIIRTVGRPSVADSVKSSLKEGFETIVVSDGPSKAKDYLAPYLSDITFLELPTKWAGNGFMCANVAAAFSTGEWLVGLDDDDTFFLGAKDIIEEFIRNNPELSIIIPGLRYNKQTTVVYDKRIVLSTDACMTPGLIEGNVGMPIYKREVLYTNPFRVYGNLNITDFLHVVDCTRQGMKVGWIGQVTHLVRPFLDGVSGSKT